LAQQAYPEQHMHGMRGLQPSSSDYGYGQRSNTLPPVPHITESQQARTLYSSRR
jgi:hypothetical protein